MPPSSPRAPKQPEPMKPSTIAETEMRLLLSIADVLPSERERNDGAEYMRPERHRNALAIGFLRDLGRSARPPAESAPAGSGLRVVRSRLELLHSGSPVLANAALVLG